MGVAVVWSAAFAAQAQPGVVAFADRPEVENRLLEERLEQLLPRLMREQGIDLWLVIAREYNDDPVFLSLVPKPRFTARRTTMLLFHDRGPQGRAFDHQPLPLGHAVPGRLGGRRP